MKLFRIFFATVLAFNFIEGRHVFANVGEALGFGSKVKALSGAGVAGGAGPFAAYHNPAALSVELEGTDRRFQFGFGLVYLQPNFLPIAGVVTQNNFTADGLVSGNVDTSSYRATFGQEIGISYLLAPEFWGLSVGLVSFLPINQLAYLDTGETYVPEYVLYRARTQRPQMEAGLGIKPLSKLRLGLGLHLSFSVTSDGTVFINTKPNSTSSMKFASSMKPKLAPFFGALFTPLEDSKELSFGAVVRLPISADNHMTMQSAAQVFGNFAGVDFNFAGVSALFYDPLSLELGSSWKHSFWGRLYGQVDYQIWSQFQAPAIQILSPTSSNGSVKIAPGILPQFNYQNIVIPRIGEEIYLSDTTQIRLSYAYRPSFIGVDQSGPGNYLDPAKHLLNLGVGLNYTRFLGFDAPCSIDFNFTFHYLMHQQIAKTDGNEAGDLTDSKIGSPGYNAGGNLYGGGVSLAFAL